MVEVALPTTPEEKSKAIDAAVKDIEKEYGKGAIIDMHQKVGKPIPCVPTGIYGLDYDVLGVGGLPKGRIIECYGNPSGGKCLTADTYIWTGHGLETIAEIFNRCGQQASCTSRVTPLESGQVQLTNENGYLEDVQALTHNCKRPVLGITTDSGKRIEVTKNHPLRVFNERGLLVWKAAQDISVGDVLFSPMYGAIDGEERITQDEAAILGYMIADGHLTNKTVTITKTYADVAAEICSLMKSVFGLEPAVYNEVNFQFCCKAVWEKVTSQYGIKMVLSADKEVPTAVRAGGKKAIKAFLSTLIECDGTIYPEGVIEYCSASKTLVSQVQLLLAGLGFPSGIVTKHNPTYDRDYYYLSIPSGYLVEFEREIGLRSERRRQQFDAAFKVGRGAMRANIPNLVCLLRDVEDMIGGDRESSDITDDLASKCIACSRKRLVEFTDWADRKIGANESHPALHLLEYLNWLIDNPATYERVTSIEDAGEKPTFDVVMPVTHSFISNGFVSHNTTIALTAIASAQRSGGKAALVDAEHALSVDWAAKNGVDVEDMLISQPDYGEQAMSIVECLISSGAFDIIVVDSVSALVPKAELEGEIGQAHVGLQARLMSQSLRKLTGLVSKTNTILLFINQIREKIGVMFGNPEATSGGRALQFYSSVRLDVRRIATIKDGETPIGNKVKIKAVKNKVAAPYRETEVDLMFDSGFDGDGSLFDAAVKAGIVLKSGSWFSLKDDRLGQGRRAAIDTMREAGLRDEVLAAVREKAEA